MGRLFDLVEAFREKKQPYAPSIAKIAAEVGVSRQTVLNWETPTKLIDKAHLVALADAIDVSYETVRDALMDDIGYLHEHQQPKISQRTVKRKSKADEARARQDRDAGE